MALTSAMLSRPRDEVSPTELNQLLRGRKFGQEEALPPLDLTVPLVSYDEKDMRELEEFCQKRGIIGVNFNSMSPRAILNMLKGKMGMTEQTTKKGLLNG